MARNPANSRRSNGVGRPERPACLRASRSSGSTPDARGPALGQQHERRLGGRVVEAQAGAVECDEGRRDAVGEVHGRDGGTDRRRDAQTAHRVEVSGRGERGGFAAEQRAAVHLADEEVEALLTRDAPAAESAQRGLNRFRVPSCVDVRGPRLAQVPQTVPGRMLHDRAKVKRLVGRYEIVMEEHAGRIALDASQLVFQDPPVGRPFGLRAGHLPHEPHRVLPMCFGVVEHREAEPHQVAGETSEVAAGEGVEVQVGDPAGREMARECRHQRIARRCRDPRVHAVRNDVVELPEVRGEVEDVAPPQLDVGKPERGGEPPSDLDWPGRDIDPEKPRAGKSAGHGHDVPARAASELQHPATFDRRGTQAVHACVGRDAVRVRVLPRAAGIVDAVVERRSRVGHRGLCPFRRVSLAVAGDVRIVTPASSSARSNASVHPRLASGLAGLGCGATLTVASVSPSAARARSAANRPIPITCRARAPGRPARAPRRTPRRAASARPPAACPVCGSSPTPP